MIAKGILGRGFKGTAAYLLHDKARARTSERVAWTHTDNLRTDSPQRAWKEMFWTAEHAETLKRESGQSSAGRKAELPVYHLSLSWAPDETPDREEMVSTARDALKTLGLDAHQALIVCHNDEPHSHVHILVNRVNPETGVMNRLSRSNIKLSAWALEYEKTQGRVRCEQRIESNRALARNQQPRHTDQIIRDAWSGSDSGRAFQSALAEQGYILAQGDKRIVVVDPTGKAINPTRQLRGVKATEIKARLKDLDTKALPSVEDAQARQYDRAQETERARAAVIAQERAVGKKEAKAGVLREAFAEAAADVAHAEETGASDTKTEARAEEVPLREDYNAAWEQAVAEAAIAYDQRCENQQHPSQITSKDSWRSVSDRQAHQAANDDRRIQKQQEAFELWANRKRAEMQSRHLDEVGELARRQANAALQHQEQMDDAYLSKEKEWRALLNNIAIRQSKGGLWYRLRQSDSDRQDAEVLEQNLAFSKTLRQQAQQTLQARQAIEMNRLEERHRRMKSDLEISLEQARKKSERGETAYEKQLKTTQRTLPRKDRDRDVGHDL
jgi:hypothetical protein